MDAAMLLFGPQGVGGLVGQAACWGRSQSRPTQWPGLGFVALLSRRLGAWGLQKLLKNP